MPFFVLPFPHIDPVLVEFGPFIVRWYAIAYLAGLLIGWRVIFALAASSELWGRRVPPDFLSIDDLIVYMALGIVVGGRLGHVFFYEPAYYFANPSEILAVWHGGMAFHGGIIGAIGAMFVLSLVRSSPFLTLTDLVSVVAPIGLFFGRIANFINGELWGRPTDVAWAMIFPRADDQPRHPSQLYEAGLEGVLLFILLAITVRLGGLKRPGLLSGLFCVFYALARTISEFFRDPDPKSEMLSYGLTMGMVLSAPMALIGLALIVFSLKQSTSA